MLKASRTNPTVTKSPQTKPCSDEYQRQQLQSVRYYCCCWSTVDNSVCCIWRTGRSFRDGLARMRNLRR